MPDSLVWSRRPFQTTSRAALGTLLVMVVAMGEPRRAHASAMETFGAGAGSTAMGGGGLAFPMDAGAVFLNPASLVRLPGQHGATVGYQLIRSEFPDFPALWWDTNRDGLVDAADEPLRIQPDYNAGDGVFVGATDKLGKRFGFGIAVFVPKDYILRLATFEPELPIYFMYDTRLQRYAMAAGFGWEQFPGVSVGGGVQLIPQARYSIVATIDATFTGAIEGDTEAWQLMRSLTLDVHEMTLDLVPGFAPMASLDWNVGRSIPALRGLYVAASWRGALGLPVDVRGDLQGNIRVEDAGDLGAVLFPLAVKVGLGVWDHYLPEQVSGGLGLELFDSLRLYGDLRWTRWSRMPVNITRVIEASVDAPFFEVDPSNIHDGNDAVAVFRDTFSLRAGGEIRLPRWDVGPPFDHVRLHLRGGAGLEPSPLLEQTVATALLDADRAVLAGGIGVEHRDPFGWVGETRWNVFGQFQRLGRGALERPVLSQPTPGQPIQADADDMTRIEIGGRLWTTGLQLDFEY